MVTSMNRAAAGGRLWAAGRAVCEALEKRALLSATLDSSTGLVTVYGTDDADTITVRHDADTSEVVVQVNADAEQR